MFWNISFTVIQELIRIVLHVLGGLPIWHSEKTHFVSIPGFFPSQNSKFKNTKSYGIDSVGSYQEEVWSSLSP